MFRNLDLHLLEPKNVCQVDNVPRATNHVALRTRKSLSENDILSYVYEKERERDRKLSNLVKLIFQQTSIF